MTTTPCTHCSDYRDDLDDGAEVGSALSTRITNTVTYAVLVPLLFAVHVIWEAGVGYWLFGLAGGIRPSPNPGGWTELGGIDRAWGSILYAPGCAILTKANIGGCIWRGGEWGLPLIALASFITAIATAQFMQAWLNKQPHRLGTLHWRGVIMFLGWMFVPLPVEWVWAYQFIVLC